MWVVHGQKKPKMALISEYLAADLSAGASADALCIINIGKSFLDESLVRKLSFDRDLFGYLSLGQLS